MQNELQKTLQPAKLLWLGDVPSAGDFDDIYFSREDGAAESRHVFLEGNNLPARFAQLAPEQTSVIAETGFGTGLNFLLAWQLWQQNAPSSAQLLFISTELFPLMHADLARSHAIWPELAALSAVLLQHYPALIAGYHWLRVAPNVTLLLLLGDARETLPHLRDSAHADFPGNPWRVDAWFLDGFAPAKNPQMWQADLLIYLALLSKQGTTLATFTAAGQVRRTLQQVGFSVQKTIGFGRKREMVRAIFTDSTKASHPSKSKQQTPWLLNANSRTSLNKTVAVIGGGLAGCHIARALAERNCRVILIEQHSALATEGSGNPQGALYTKLSANTSALARFGVASFLYALRHYRQAIFKDAFFDCGLLQLREKTDTSLLGMFSNNPEFLRWLNQAQATEQASAALNKGGIWLPLTGWLQPQAVCAALVQHTNICVQTSQTIAHLERSENQWRLTDLLQQEVARADHAVLACANRTQLFSQSDWLPLRPVRGQITMLPATSASEFVKCVICDEGYFTPAHNAEHCLGAGFIVGDTATELRAYEQQHNLDLLSAISPDLRALWPTSGTAIAGRAALRATTPDHLPLAGALPDRKMFLTNYSSLCRNAKKAIPKTGSYIDGLWVFTGFGGRGLCYIPLAAELLAAQLLDLPRPLPRDLQMALAPARFLIRELMRTQLRQNAEHVA